MKKTILVSHSEHIKQQIENRINNLENKLNAKPEEQRHLIQSQNNQIITNNNILNSELLQANQSTPKQNDIIQKSKQKSIGDKLYSNDKKINQSENREHLPQFGVQSATSKEEKKYQSKNKSSRKHQLLRTTQKSSANKNSETKNHAPGLIKTTTLKSSENKESSRKKELEQQNFLLKNENVVNTFSEFKNYNDYTKGDSKSKLQTQTPYKQQTNYCRGLLDNIKINQKNQQFILKNSFRNDQVLKQQKYYGKQYLRQKDQSKKLQHLNYDRIHQLQKQRILRQLNQQSELRRLRQLQIQQRINQQIYLKQQQRKMIQNYKIPKLRHYQNQDIYKTYVNNQMININHNQESLLEKYTRGERARQYEQILLLLQKQNILKQLQRPLVSYNRINSAITPQKQGQQHSLLKRQPHYETNQNLDGMRKRNLTVTNIKYRNTKNYYQPYEQTELTHKSPQKTKKHQSQQSNSVRDYKEQISTSKKRLKFNAEHQQNVKNIANKRIKNRLCQSWAIYEDAFFRNNKHERQHLLNTYEKQNRLRKQIIQKILGQTISKKKFGLLKVLQ